MPDRPALREQADVSQDYFEVWKPEAGPSLEQLKGSRIAIGRAESNQIVLDDPKISRLHAVMEHYPAGWSIRDLGSSNGTTVNGEPVRSEHRLLDGDEITLGDVRIVFRSGGREGLDLTAGADDPPPATTKREKDVLVSLCRPLMTSRSFAQAATIQEMASDLVVNPATVKFHLANLYDKFGIIEGGYSRRGHLANEAIRRGAVTMRDLQDPRAS
jgi:predicted component of type VI protein secretion system